MYIFMHETRMELLAAIVEVYRQIADLIRSKCNIIINFTTGGGGNLNIEERISCLDANPEVASLNMGSLVRTIGPYAGTLFINTSEDIEWFAKEMIVRDIKPEMEIYHHGMLREVYNLINKKLVNKPYYINFSVWDGISRCSRRYW